MKFKAGKILMFLVVVAALAVFGMLFLSNEKIMNDNNIFTGNQSSQTESVSSVSN